MLNTVKRKKSQQKTHVKKIYKKSLYYRTPIDITFILFFKIQQDRFFKGTYVCDFGPLVFDINKSYLGSYNFSNFFKTKSTKL
jgi:hypothetical protein